MSTGASLHANETPWAVLEQSKQLTATKPEPHKNQTVLVYTMDLEDALCEVDTYCSKF